MKKQIKVLKKIDELRASAGYFLPKKRLTTKQEIILLNQMNKDAHSEIKV